MKMQELYDKYEKLRISSELLKIEINSIKSTVNKSISAIRMRKISEVKPLKARLLFLTNNLHLLKGVQKKLAISEINGLKQEIIKISQQYDEQIKPLKTSRAPEIHAKSAELRKLNNELKNLSNEIKSKTVTSLGDIVKEFCNISGIKKDNVEVVVTTSKMPNDFNPLQIKDKHAFEFSINVYTLNQNGEKTSEYYNYLILRNNTQLKDGSLIGDHVKVEKTKNRLRLIDENAPEFVYKIVLDNPEQLILERPLSNYAQASNKFKDAINSVWNKNNSQTPPIM